MWGNYLTLGIRSLMKNGTYAFINIVGLALGLAACLLLLLDDPGLFVVAGLLALAIAIGTVSTHAIRVARTNPIHALRYE